MKSSRTTSRKQQHVELPVAKDVGFRTKTAGFERWEFLHNALPELDPAEIDPSVSFLGKTLAFPLIISSMTGGYRDALRINRQLAEVCADQHLAMGVGSQRQALENPVYHRTFSVVREVSRDIPIFGNIGAAEVAKLGDASPVQRLVDLVEADGFAVHLNPLQEFLQPEGNPQFRGVLRGIELLVNHLSVPVLVKEIGAGISGQVARRLVDVGVRIIDVAGAGGTSWAGVEILRRNGTGKSKSREEDFAPVFWDWGIPTVDALRQVTALRNSAPDLTVIASGGISGGLDIAKAIAFGGDLAAAARPMIKVLETGGPKRLLRLLQRWRTELTGAMFLTGSRTLADLRQQHLVLKP
ncbi:MAG: type 2 isopentenyl-diphosphate Delta-isomerase [Bacteroidota bacterium]